MPERKSTTAGPALTGGPAANPVVLIRPAEAVPRAGGIDEARVDPVQLWPADAEPVHCPRREILEQDIGALGHLEQQGAAAFVLQIEGDRPLVRVQHRN